MPENRNQMGDDVDLVIDGEVVPVTNKGWTWTQETTSSNFDDSRNPDRGVTTRYPEGDLEYDGTKKDLERRLIEAGEQKHRLIFRETDVGGGYRVTGVLITEIDKGHPGDDKSNVSISWEGERLVPF